MATWNQYIYGDGQQVFIDQMTTRPHTLNVVGTSFLVWQDTGRPSYFDAYGSNLSSSGNPSQLNDGGTITSFAYHIYNSYPAVEITDVSLTTAYFKANILSNGSGASGTEVTFRAFMNTQEWTFNGSPGTDTFSSGSKADKLFGYSGDDTLNGFAGNDVVDGGSGKDTLDGGIGQDVLSGGEGNDTLIGGTEADQMFGGNGDDTYSVDNAADRVLEVVGGGAHDFVFANVSYALTAGQEVETLTCSFFVEAQGPINLSGNEFDQVIGGNSASNILSGLGGNDQLYGNNGSDKLDGGVGSDRISGGDGNDTLFGGKGYDRFIFDTALGAANVDHIQDFANASGDNDTFYLDNAIFTKLTAAGYLDAAFFKDITDGAKLDSNDRIIYSEKTGVVTYDTNGSGAGGAVTVAILDNKAHLTAADFVVI